MATPMQFDLTDQQTEEARPYVCLICNKRFTQKGHLMTHQRTHTGEKPYSCNICNKRFSQSSHLNTHKRIHTGIKPYYCTECGMGFCRKRRLEKHCVLHDQFININSKIENLQDLLRPNVTKNQSQSVFPSSSNSMESFPENETSQPHRRKLSLAVHLNNDNFEPEVGIQSHDRVVIKLEDEETDNLLQNDSQPQLDTDSTRQQVPNTGMPPNIDLTHSEASEEGSDSIVMGGGDFNNASSPICDDIDLDRISITSDGNLSGSENNHPDVFHHFHHRRGMGFRGWGRGRPKWHGFKRRNLYRLEKNLDQCLASNFSQPQKSNDFTPQVNSNNEVNLSIFTTADLLTHMMSRDNVYKCDFCCTIFQDAAMYHLHKSMHDKMDVRCCNLCGKMSEDKYDFTAHFLSEHK